MVCMERLRTVGLAPCGHLVLREDCCGAVQEAGNQVRCITSLITHMQQCVPFGGGGTKGGPTHVGVIHSVGLSPAREWCLALNPISGPQPY